VSQCNISASRVNARRSAVRLYVPPEECPPCPECGSPEAFICRDPQGAVVICFECIRNTPEPPDAEGGGE
jgi:hypothetical protein